MAFHIGKNSKSIAGGMRASIGDVCGRVFTRRRPSVTPFHSTLNTIASFVGCVERTAACFQFVETFHYRAIGRKLINSHIFRQAESHRRCARAKIECDLTQDR